MRSVGLKTLKNKLSEYVRLAQSGETVLVTDRDRVVAEIIAPREGRAERINDVELAHAVRARLVPRQRQRALALVPGVHERRLQRARLRAAARYERLGEFLAALSPDELRPVLDEVRRERESETEAGAPAWDAGGERDSAEAYLGWLMDRDRKSTALKSVQGRIWERAFLSGEVRGAVYPDVPPALERWTSEGRGAAIFSSGSVLAQRLLFGHSTAGDLTRFLSGYFDTTTGPKRESDSYRRIAAALAEPPAAVLFVSDVVAELVAAREAGMETALCVRDSPPPGGTGEHRVVRTFAALP